MQITFSTELRSLTHDLDRALDTDGLAEIADLPNSDDWEIPPLSLWVFRHPDSYEIAIPEVSRYNGANTLMREACRSEPLPGGFRSVAEFEAAGLRIHELASFIINDVIGADSPPLTDIDAAIGSVTQAPVPTPSQLADSLAATVKGQDQALGVVAAQLVTHMFKTDPKRPLRLFLVGPSGVGKGATLDAVADAMGAGDQEPWQTVRVDCNQLKDVSSVSDLIGASAGYVGHGQGSPLITALASSPRTIVLFDEIDKADPSISETLMGMMDTGELRLRKPVGGRWTLDCRRAILIFTSNQAADEITTRTVGMSAEQASATARDILIASGMPEYIAGRHGAIAVYRPIDRDTAAEILALETVRHAHEFGLDLRWIEPEVVAAMLSDAKVGRTGARELYHVVEQHCGPAFIEFLNQRRNTATDRGGDDSRTAVVVTGRPPEVVDIDTWIAAGATDEPTCASVDAND